MIALLQCCSVLAILFCLQFQPTYGVDWDDVYEVCLWDCSLDHASCRTFANWDYNAKIQRCQNTYFVPHNQCFSTYSGTFASECYDCYLAASNELSRDRNRCDTTRNACNAHCDVSCEITPGTGQFPEVNF